jgi:hypothetical protein
VFCPIMRRMEAQELKSLVAAGEYKPDLSEVAAAMLSKRGVRELLTGVSPAVAPSGRSRPPRPARPQAA